ncbi:MAG: RMD1 family protein [Patescibacteria group bacterium]
MDLNEYNLEAHCLAKEINLAKTAEKLDKNLIGRRREFLTYLVGPKEFVFIFSFGVVVFVNIAKDSQSAFRKSLSKFLISPVKKTFNESYVLREREGKINVGDEATDLPAIGVEEIGIAARVLAQSVALEYIEDITDEALSNVDSANAVLGDSGIFFQNTRAILKLVSQNNGTIQFVISKLSLLDKPEITWEHKQLEMLFSQLSDIFELRSRFKNIEYKIDFTRTNSEFAFDVMQSRRANFLEWMIILLFVIDLILLFWLG